MRHVVLEHHLLLVLGDQEVSDIVWTQVGSFADSVARRCVDIFLILARFFSLF